MHPNDTLKGKLIAHELPEERHLRQKLGYWRMVEERVVRAELIAAGEDPQGPWFFTKLLKAIEENHKDDPPHSATSLMVGGAIRQQADFERALAIEAVKDAALEALRKIADGHNDPRTLAMEVLGMLPADET